MVANLRRCLHYLIIILTAEVMYNTNGDKYVVACRNNLETAYLWIIETAKTTDVYKFSELCGQNVAMLAFSNHPNVLNSVPIRCWKHLWFNDF